MRASWFAVSALGLGACNPDTKLCHERMQGAQALVAQVDGKSAASVERSLAAVTEAHAVCEKAKLGGEREQLLRAKHELSAQLELLDQRANRKKAQPPSAEELSQLLKTGDRAAPRVKLTSPRMQAEVRCTGPQLVEMGASALKVTTATALQDHESRKPAEVRPSWARSSTSFRSTS